MVAVSLTHGDLDYKGERRTGYLLHRKYKLAIINSKVMPRQAIEALETGN